MHGEWDKRLPAFIDSNGQWISQAPETVRWGCFVFPGLVPVWRSFKRLSVTRMHTLMGRPLPLQYRDIRDEAARHGDSDAVFDRLLLLDQRFRELSTPDED